MAGAALQTAGRLHCRPEASQTHSNNYTCIQKLAAQRITRTQSTHNSASPFARARQHCTAAAKAADATIPHKHTPNKALNMTQSKRRSPCACHQRKGTAAHACTARAALRTTGRQGFRPEASQNHLNNVTCIHKLAAQRMGFIRCSHNRAVQPMRARQHESIALRQEKAGSAQARTNTLHKEVKV